MSKTAIKPHHDITAVILAGGRGSRLNGVDKGLLYYQDKTLVEIALQCLQEVTGSQLISCNRNIEIYRQYNVQLVQDEVQNYSGPLAGVNAALTYTESRLLLVWPVDCPLLPADLVSLMVQTLAGSRDCNTVAISCSGKLSPLPFLMDCKLKNELRLYLEQGGRAVYQWLNQTRCAQLQCPFDPRLLLNINTPEDLKYGQAESENPTVSTQN